jgi:hypothetical protein
MCHCRQSEKQNSCQRVYFMFHATLSKVFWSASHFWWFRSTDIAEIIFPQLQVESVKDTFVWLWQLLPRKKLDDRSSKWWCNLFTARYDFKSKFMIYRDRPSPQNFVWLYSLQANVASLSYSHPHPSSSRLHLSQQSASKCLIEIMRCDVKSPVVKEEVTLC